jgi:predicted DNA-binding transcriptional regulator AlpA
MESSTIPEMHHLVGVTEIAQMLGVSPQRVIQLCQKPDFPEPTAVLANGRIWHRADVEEWAKQTGRIK